MSAIGPEPLFGITKWTISRLLNERTKNLSLTQWENQTGQKHAKNLIVRYSLKKTSVNLIKLPRTQLEAKSGL